MALQGTGLQDLVAQLKSQVQSVNDQIASKQQELAGLQGQRQVLVAQIADIKAYILAQGG